MSSLNEGSSQGGVWSAGPGSYASSRSEAGGGRSGSGAGQPPEDVPSPPQPPSMPRRILLTTFQFLFLPVLVLLPVLALFGVFGLAKVTSTGEAGPLTVTAEYPRRIRYGVSEGARLRVTNDGASALSRVRLAMGRDWVEHFGTVSFVPSPVELTADEYRFELGDIPPGESRLVVMDLTADGYLGRSALVTVTAEATDTASVELATFIFP